ncbi:hypothetical protein ABNB59_09190 [Paenibacillus larvae]|uniref:Uncharacterized protein n=3 Tax=Paenibacillus larvae TaxID=1464 RepID=V9W1U9_9BACL|nr:hypothetical protein [Paenibacillus larvae]AHD04981.1 hypothetical protein ERIC2_c11480 [Paenibacillus larvae subsp. larvae DSM 25430]AQR78018.1 hypothetical protein BXP28_12470 [Paenibacillus larvae subsp. larvae]AVF20821.1 hypothetical protein ERICI_00910 [Paenibacillus larvae subsp. larvae]AVG11526.1 hypothetical protein ERICII_01109 [Paenibacillus larvae subsp. larvae DSM 25430]ETK28211.1 hypothetical protein ERIC1_1c16720 [Paenibacillus larvae subsp. larvae DSM 25719]
MLDHLDDTAFGMMERKKPPLIEEKLIHDIIQDQDSPILEDVELDLDAELEILKQIVAQLDLHAKKKNEVLDCICVMQEGAGKKDGKLIIKAMTLYLNSLEITELKERLELIEKQL